MHNSNPDQAVISLGCILLLCVSLGASFISSPSKADDINLNEANSRKQWLSGLRICADKKDNLERLTCFDRHLAAIAQWEGGPDSKVESTAEKPSEAEMSSWNTSESKNPLDDSPTVIVTSTVNDFNGDVGNFFVAARCVRGKTSLVFGSGELLGFADTMQVEWRIDSAPPVKADLSVSDSNKALGYWTGAAAIPILKKMSAGKKMVISIYPRIGSRMNGIVSLVGFDQNLSRIKSACKW